MRTNNILIRVNENEKSALENAAREQGLPISSWARLELLRRAKSIKETRQEATNQPKRTGLPLLSLFSGTGGLDEGFKLAGFSTLVAIDNDKDCVDTFAYNHPSSIVLQRDIRTISVQDLDNAVGGELQPVGVIGGPPCQSFSVSNVHQKDDDPRHNLPEAYAILLKSLNCRSPISFFVFENVPGLLGTRHLHRYEKFRALFRDAGFEIYERRLDAKNYGVPQERERIFIIGINHSVHSHRDWIPPEPEKKITTVRDAIYGLPDPVLNAPGLDPETFPVHPNHWCLVPRSRKFAESKLEQGQMWGRSFRTLYWDKPSWVVAYGHREVHVHPNGHRRLSIYEAMLLQTFPSRYRLTGNMSAQIRLVSEAVPVRLAWHIAQSIRNSLSI